MENVSVKSDVAVIGAGIIGAACAFELARNGMDVALFDAAAPTAGSSGACDGYVSVSTKIPGPTMELALASKHLYPEFVRALSLDVEYVTDGGMLIIEDEDDVSKIEAHVAALRENGVPIEMLSRREMLAREPHLNPSLIGAAFCPIEAHVSPFLMNMALVAAAVRHGARTFWNTPARGFEMAANGVAAMNTPAGRVEAEQFVICTGIWSSRLGEMVGLELPVEPRRGQLVVTQRSESVASRFLASAKYLTAKADPETTRTSTDPLVRLGYGFIIERTKSGQHIIGSTRTFSGFDRGTSTSDVALILREAAKRIPAIADLTVLRSFAGLRPYVPDKKPFIGRSGLVPNLLVATGHEGDGITMAPITGRLIAELAAGRKPSVDVAAFNPDRFTVH